MTGLITWAERVGSTQDVVHGVAADGAADGTAVVAVEQTGGRGSRGRSWHSLRGGLWLSVLVRPAGAPPGDALSLRVALAVAEVLDAFGVPGVAVKWPNDLLLAGRKAGGILCEARWVGDRLAWIAIGVGLNVANAIPTELEGTAVSLASVQPELRPGDLALPVINAVRAAAREGGLLDRREQRAFAARDWLRGRVLHSPVAGIAEGVLDDGALRVRRADGAVETVRVGPAVAGTT